MANFMAVELSYTLMGLNTKDNSFMAIKRATVSGYIPMEQFPRGAIKMVNSLPLISTIQSRVVYTQGNALQRAYLTVMEPSLTRMEKNMLDHSETANARVGMKLKFIQTDLPMKNYGYMANRMVTYFTLIPSTKKKALPQELELIPQEKLRTIGKLKKAKKLTKGLPLICVI